MSEIPKEYKHLNDNQKEGVLADLGPHMVIAGPGSGKTHVIIHRIHYMIKHLKVEPRNILVITFTKAAATEMRDRFLNMEDIPRNAAAQISFGTFHAIFFKMLRGAYGYKVDQLIRGDERFKFLTNLIGELGIEDEDPREFVDNFIKEMSLMRNNLIDLKYYHPDGIAKDTFETMVKKYEAYKARHNKIDFDDMLTHCYHMLKEDENMLEYFRDYYGYVLVDEFQDINRVQYEVIKMISAPKNNIFIVGDDDQSIYIFRGARPEFLMQFPKEFEGSKRTVLDINYRSTSKIIESSNKLIKNNKERYPKVMKTPNEEGLSPAIVRCLDQEDEAKKVASKILKLHSSGTKFTDMAVVFRTNIQSRSIVDAFMNMNIPFYLQDSIPSLYEHWIARDMLAYFKLTKSLNDNKSLLRIMNKPKRYISKSLISQAMKVNKDGILRDIYNIREAKRWQIDKLEELRFQLQQLRSKTPYNGVKYISDVIGYKGYLKEYAQYRKIPESGLLEILAEVQEASKGYETYDEWAQHIEEILKELKEQKADKYKRTNEKERKGVILTTMHSAKGLEFERVFLIGLIEGIIPHSKNNSSPAEIEEERRLFYVGITRAKKQAYIYIPQHKHEGNTEESRFIEEITYKG